MERQNVESSINRKCTEMLAEVPFFAGIRASIAPALFLALACNENLNEGEECTDDTILTGGATCGDQVSDCPTDDDSSGDDDSSSDDDSSNTDDDSAGDDDTNGDDDTSSDDDTGSDDDTSSEDDTTTEPLCTIDIYDVSGFLLSVSYGGSEHTVDNQNEINGFEIHQTPFTIQFLGAIGNISTGFRILQDCGTFEVLYGTSFDTIGSTTFDETGQIIQPNTPTDVIANATPVPYERFRLVMP